MTSLQTWYKSGCGLMKNVFVHILNYMRIDNYFLAANASSAFVFRIIGLKMNRTLWQIVNTKYKLTPQLHTNNKTKHNWGSFHVFLFLDMNTESCICIVYHEVNVYILNFYLKTLFYEYSHLEVIQVFESQTLFKIIIWICIYFYW